MKAKKILSSLFITALISAALGVCAFAAEQTPAASANAPAATQQETAPSVIYQAHVQKIGNQKAVADGALAGTSHQSKRIEGLRIRLNNAKNSSIEYRAHVQSVGWQGWKTNYALAGTSRQSKRIEALQIRLKGDIAKTYDVYYRVHVQHIGWMNWAKDGEFAGTVGKSYRIEGIQIKLVKQGEKPTNAPVNVASATSKAFIYDAVSYRTHVQKVGTQKWVADGALAGTTGRSLRVEGIALKLADAQYLGASGNIEYRAHVQRIGWQGWKKNGKYAGTTGRKLRVEALQIRLTGAVAEQYDVYYSVHVQNYGWLAWAKDGETAGTEGLAFRIEAVRVKLVKKGAAAPSNSGRDSHTSLSKDLFKQNVGVRYQTHVQDTGWTSWSSNGATSGTTGKSKRVEAYRVAVDDKLAGNTYITYHSHIQSIGDKQGWVNSKNTAAYSGTTGKSKRVEAIQMKLGGYASRAMNVYYRVYAQKYGWLGWAKNGQWAGTSNGKLRVEAIQIVLRTKNEKAPGSTARHYIKINSYPQANAVLNKIGRNLRAAYNWSAGLKYWRQSYSPNMGTRWYANIGFSQHRGNCYVMAATFTEMARALGYNAHQVVGYVPHIGGGDAPHSWVEIDEKDGTWVYDPNLTNELHLPGYHFKYGHAQTWRYYKYHRTKLK